MNKSLRIILALVALMTAFQSAVLAQDPGNEPPVSKNYYWVGGTANGAGDGNWNTLGNWRLGSATSPDVPTTPPTTIDDVFFGSTSFSNAAGYGSKVTVAPATPTPACRNFNWNVTDRATTLEVNTSLEIKGSVTITNGTNTPRQLSITASTAVLSSGTASIKFTAAGAATIQSGGQASATQQNLKTTYGVPVIFDGISSDGATLGRWLLQDNMTIGYRVTFVNGYVEAPTYNATTLANSRMMILNDRASDNTVVVPVGASNNSHVIGYIRKQALTGMMVMPVGAGSGMYRPIIARMNNSNPVTAKYFNADPNTNPDPVLTRTNILPMSGTNSHPQLKSVSNREYWFITSNNNSGLRIDLNYDRPNLDGEEPKAEIYYFMNDPVRRATLTVAGWNRNGGWTDLNINRQVVIDPVAKIIQSAGSLNQVEYFTIASRGVSPLPVRLVSFTAQQLDGQVQLKWQSTSEENTSHFDVERSADGKNFSLLLTKKAQGNSATLVSYNALDNSPLGGTSYYRLRMVDLDGTFEYSNLVSVSSESTVQVRAFPNPSNGRYVQFLALNGDKLVLQSVMDAFGRPVAYEASPVYGQGLYVNFYGALPAGFYVATLVTDDDKRERVRIKFVVP
jgi:hypothetical protein